MTQPHTPAPWRVDDEALQTSGELFIRDDSDTIICEIFGETFDEFGEERREANAQLIAAAPELLAALQDFVERDRVEAAGNGFTDDEMSWLEDARRVIAKATGA